MTTAPHALERAGVDRDALARYVGWLGVALGVLAFFLTLPPITARSPVVPLVVGGLGLVAGALALREGAGRRLATGAMAAAAAGAILGWLCTRSDVESLDQVFVWSALIAATLRAATPLTFAALGGIISERSGVINIGLEGMLLMGAFFGFLGADKLGSWWWGILCGIVAGAALASVHAFIAIHLRADQIVSGFAANFLALGITGYFFIEVYTDQGTPGDVSNIPSISIPWIRDLGFVGPAIGDMHVLIWVALAFVVLSHLLLFHTPIGLRLRSVGEHPKAADTVGISVYTIRYGAVILSGALAGLGGVYLSNGITHSFNENMSAGRGFIALAAVIFGRWRPFGALVACLLFGFTEALALRLPGAYGEDAAWTTLFRALPYVVTLIVVAGVVGRSIPPAAVGRPYVKR
ncbi:MAG: ABC transporter permease [Actinomycetota bacterium]|nr:ABC transporter permease [Actinomycetota bacterium]